MSRIDVTFRGAARTVTGSLHELQIRGKRYLLDCGLYQGRRAEAREVNCCHPFPARDVHAVMLSHAHIDHSGNLPLLVRDGFSGPIYASAATADLCRLMLSDSAHIQEKDALYLNKRRRRHRKIDPRGNNGEIEPLYRLEDAERVYPQFHKVPLRTETEVGPGVSYRSFEAGHMLGSTSMMIRHNNLRLIFSGDVGRVNLPILKDPDPMEPAQYLIMESTYGDRLHHDPTHVSDKLAAIVNRTAARGGKIIAPAFAVGRTQALIYLLAQLICAQKVPRIPVYIDSPLAVSASEVFLGHGDLFDQETKEFLHMNGDPREFPFLHFIRDVEESKALNDFRMPCVIVSASGMCEAGRVLHHLKNNIEDSRNTVLITGFQAEHTLGRKIVDGQAEVPVFGEPLRLRAEVAVINELSGHADQQELLEWMKPIVPALRRVFLVHGELSQQQALKRAVEARYSLDVVIPARGDHFVLT
jgi:metallo-beta-lactamase family protein